MKPKRLTEAQLLGERGVALIAIRVLEMGFVWRPTGTLDSGIDGEIEIRDRVTGAMSGLILKVQSKAVTTFDNETADGFDYWPEGRDVTYWLGHNVPVIIVLSRPSSGEAYWQAIRPASDQARGRKIVFVKQRDLLGDTAATTLTELARQGSPGAAALPVPACERLTSNLLTVAKLPKRLYLAETPLRTPSELIEALRGKDLTIECSLREKRILTVRDLTDPRYEFLCDRGTVEDFPVDHWAKSDDPDTQRDFVRVLNQCLRQLLRTSKARLRHDRETGAFYFPLTKGRQRSSHGYMAQKKTTKREVVMPLMAKKTKHLMGYRHAAIWSNFRRFDGLWYLEITPTYFFTGQSGEMQSAYHSAWLAGIKRLEKNPALLGQLLMWEELLARNSDFFTAPYPYLAFGKLLSFDTDRGIDDAAWSPPDFDAPDLKQELPHGLFDSL